MNLDQSEIELGRLVDGPHAGLIRDMAQICWRDKRIQAIWVGGSLAAGQGDQFSDVDFRIAVKPGQVRQWTAPDWEQYLPTLPCGSTLMRFGEEALLHHLVLADGTIVDFYVQDTTQDNYEPALIVLAARDPDFAARLAKFSRPAAPLVNEIDGAAIRQLLVDYWITTLKQVKALARKYDLSPFVGLYFERLALLRAWYLKATGRDISSRPTLHMLGVLHKGLGDHVTARQKQILGLPSRTPEETVKAIEAIRAEMTAVGRWLASQHDFDYPYALETAVDRLWQEHVDAVTRR